MILKVLNLLRMDRKRFLPIIIACVLFTSLLVLGPKANTAEGIFDKMRQEEKTIVWVEVDGVKLEIRSSASNVAGVINEVGLFIGESDIIRPDIETPLSGISSIEILRVTKEVVVETKNVDVEIEYEDRTDLEIGRELVLHQGQVGIVEQMIEIRYINGEEYDRVVIAEEVLQEPKNKVIAMGKQDIITKDNVTFSFTKFLPDAELTAYAAGFVHTGKNPGDYWYGMTFTGTEVEEGRTVAVDPKVIPLGWWMYIEGYGFRRAEDTGSAVKNKRVDIYFDDDEFVSSFGLKRNAKIWVIGPNDPRR